MHDLVKKSEGAIAVADEKKNLSTHEALHELHKGLTAQVKDWEQKCLDLRKAELAKSAGRQPKTLHEAYKRHAAAGNHADAADAAEALHHFHSEALHGSHGNHNGDHDAYHDGQQKKFHALAQEHKAKAGLKKALPGELSHTPVSSGSAPPTPVAKNFGNPAAYGPGGSDMPKSEMKCSESPMCKCGDCSKVEKYAKGEIKPTFTSKEEGKKQTDDLKAQGKLKDIKHPEAKKGEMPPAKGGKIVEGADSKEAGSDGTNVKPMKKAALPGAAPAAPKMPGAAAGGAPSAGPKLPKTPKLPGMGKPAAPAGVPKPPAMGAGQPALKTEMKKDETADLKTVNNFAATQGKTLRPIGAAKQAIKLPGVRASVGNTMDKMGAQPPAPKAAAPHQMPAPLAGVGQPVMKPVQGVQTMAERVASRMTPNPTAALARRPAADAAHQQPRCGATHEGQVVQGSTTVEP
jgi:hypothetical protein